MKAIADHEKAYGAADAFTATMNAHASAKNRFLAWGFSLSLAAFGISLLLHWLAFDVSRTLAGSLAGLGLGIFFVTCLGGVHIRRPRCPLCVKKVELRRHYPGSGGEEHVIAICRHCKVQAPTGMSLC